MFPSPCGEGEGWGSGGFAPASTPRSNLPTPPLPPHKGEGEDQAAQHRAYSQNRDATPRTMNGL
jgi:hypothetical protein